MNNNFKKSVIDAIAETQDGHLKSLRDNDHFSGEVGVNVESVQITNMLPIEADQIPTTFSLTGYELKQINDAIEKLIESYKGKKVSIYESVQMAEW